MRLPQTKEPRDLTDRGALARYRKRALAFASPAMFLHEHAADLCKERLEEVNRSFRDTAVVSGFPTMVQGWFPDARTFGDTETLPLEPARSELFLHLLALHWSNDPVGQMIQARRALRPDGLFLGVTFGGQTLHELRTALAEAEARLVGGLSPRVAPMGEIRDYGGLLQRAGFALPVADSIDLTVEYESALHLMRDLRAMGEVNALAARPRTMTRRSLIEDASRIYAEHFTTGSGRVRATFEMVFLTGWAPSETQQKPLRPGSAQARLSDALGVQERPAGEKTGRDDV